MKQIAFFIGLSLILFGCGGPVSKNNKDATQLSQDSISLVSLLNQDIKVGNHVLESIPIIVTELSNENCRLRVMLPADRNGKGAESLGVEKCTTVVKWLSENGYDLGLGGIYVSCYVCSPYEGTTGRQDMLIQWGRARYDPNSDRVEWKPAK